MNWKDDARQQHGEVLDALDAVRREVGAQAVHEPPRDRGYQSWPRRFPAYAIALRLCVNVSEEPGEDGRYAVEALAQRFQEVPESHRDGATVRCTCGAGPQPLGDLQPCIGACGRYFVGDAYRALVVRLEP